MTFRARLQPLSSWGKYFIFATNWVHLTSSLGPRRRSYASSYSPRPRTLPPPRLDYRNIAENYVYKCTNALNRKASLNSEHIRHVSRLYSELNRHSRSLNAKRHARSLLGELIRKHAEMHDEQAKQAALQEAKNIKDELAGMEATFTRLERELLKLALAIPNDTHPSSPLGPEDAAITLASHGPACIPASPSRDHLLVAKKLKLINVEDAANTTGNSWYFLTNEGALLELALTNYAMFVAMKHGFQPTTTPDVVRSDIAERCGFQPRDNAQQSYHLQSTSPSSPELILAGTAEIPLAGMFADRIFPHRTLPKKVVGLGHAFRAEAGARGADTRGLYRVHQFSKLELFVVTKADKSEAAMEEMRRVQESILIGLDIPLRVLDMPTEVLGASAYRKYDIEAWMPGRGSWGEVASLSNCTDYQARRLHIRYQEEQDHQNVCAHTLNGTAAAIPRLIVALIENGVEFDEAGEPVAISLPAVLKPYWLGTSSQDTVVRWKA
ncbi:hypothetical protein D9757_004607 [Collybiopsis confluens]|uniref:serine--tRNA ligase n=1 Tax=Collybiopsis confluens TaxID=2823264 RepID=A0A8H5HSU1_9AGAR|nr:hypothetical protein D9757_004607 [Collybiopsis confluens]